MLNFDPNLIITVLTGEKLYKNLRKNIPITYLSKNVAFIGKNLFGASVELAHKQITSF